MAFALCATAASAQADRAVCTTDSLFAGFPRAWIGTRVGQVTIRARNVESPNAFMDGAVRLLHRPTQLSVVAAELSFSAGQSMDSLAVLESVRRLRRTSLFSEIIIEGTRCGGDSPTDITIWTRDAWSIRGDFRVGRTSSRATLSDVNIWGTGRSLAVRGEELDDRRSFTVAYGDPYLFGTPFRGAVLLRSYADGRAWQWGLRSREYSPRDAWRAVLLNSQLRRLGDDQTLLTHTDIDRWSTMLAVSRRIILEPRDVWALVGGVEHERANLTVVQPGPQLGRPEVRREFVAPLVGVQRRSMQFGAIDWLVPGQPPAELPTGVDGELVVATGHDLRTNARITHVDGWVGGTALPAAGTIVTADIWSSGYWSSDSVSNGSLRMAAAVFQRARHGMWILRAASERIYNPDPDVFALSTADPMLRLLTPQSRLAESALNVGVERAFHLRTQEHRWVLDGALFATYSERHRSVDQAFTEVQNPRAIIIGIGLRQVRNQPTQAPLRLDIGRAAWRSHSLPDRWIVVLSTIPWLNGGRMRDGVRDGRQ